MRELEDKGFPAPVANILTRCFMRLGKSIRMYMYLRHSLRVQILLLLSASMQGLR
jgi:hypothetical protein